MPSAAQSSIRKMGYPFNHPALNYWSPYISLDGAGLLFQSDNTENRSPALFYSSKIGPEWTEPVFLPKVINGLSTFNDGATLSHDGREIWFPIQASGGIGGFDLLVAGIKKDGFTDGKNPGMPINSKEHEASAVFSPDGSRIFFMRCETINREKAGGCRILTALKKSNGSWDLPVELPEVINKGNSQFPRILADGETLVFFSDKHQPNLGGLDIYMSRFDGTNWSNPISLSFLNTPENERPVSIAASGRSIMASLAGTKKFEITDVSFPTDLKPNQVLRINGSFASDVDPKSVYVSLYDSATGKQLTSIRPDPSGNFTIYIPFGKSYRIFCDPANDHLAFFSKGFDLSSGQGQVIQKLMVELPKLETNLKFDLGVITFLENTAPSPSSIPQLNRLIRMMQANPALSFQINSDAETFDLIFRHLRKKGVNNSLENFIPEIPTGSVVMIVQ